MRTMLLAFLAIVVIALVSGYGLQEAGFSSQERYSSGNVRLN